MFTLTNPQIDAIAQIKRAVENANQLFIERELVGLAYAYSTINNSHALLIGKPGTSKSGIINALSRSLGLGYRSVAMNPDITREDMVGAVDPQVVSTGKWARIWDSLAVADIAFIDEVGKGVGSNLNILLSLMQEREVSANGLTHKVPLISAFGATNEIFNNISPALWDRFQMRLIVGPVTDENFKRMLKTDIGTMGSYPVNRQALVELGEICKQMARNLPDDIADLALALRIHSAEHVDYISDRRWRSAMELAAASALYDGRTTITAADLAVSPYVLWDMGGSGKRASEIIASVVSYVHDICDVTARALREAVALVEAHEARWNTDYRYYTSANNASEIAMAAIAIERNLSNLHGQNGETFADLRARLSTLKNKLLAL